MIVPLSLSPLIQSIYVQPCTPTQDPSISSNIQHLLFCLLVQLRFPAIAAQALSIPPRESRSAPLALLHVHVRPHPPLAGLLRAVVSATVTALSPMEQRIAQTSTKDANALQHLQHVGLNQAAMIPIARDNSI